MRALPLFIRQEIRANADESMMIFPQWSGSVAVGPLVLWMLLLTVKHVIADFFLQNSWIALGKDSKTHWLLPLTVHCLIHGVLAMLVIVPFAPRLWFLGIADFVVHFLIDRAKGFCVARYEIGMDHQWFWWLIGIDQALHHLTDLAWALILAVN
jgi:hypothetical protein